MYHPTYQRPPKANSKAVRHIAQLSTLVSTLDEALTELVDRKGVSGKENTDFVNDATSLGSSTNSCGSSNTSVSVSVSVSANERKKKSSEKEGNGDTIEMDRENDNAKNVLLDENCKKRILQKVGEAQEKIIWQQQESVITKESNPSSDSVNNNQSTENQKRDQDRIVKEAPAALLRGNLKYYNRFKGQWRIVVSNAVLRPRVNIDYDRNNKKRNCTSLWDQSKMPMAKQLKKTNSINIDEKLIQEFPTDDDGGIHLTDDLVILAYDDV